jgi:hypothetical protein
MYSNAIVVTDNLKDYKIITETFDAAMDYLTLRQSFYDEENCDSVTNIYKTNCGLVIECALGEFESYYISPDVYNFGSEEKANTLISYISENYPELNASIEQNSTAYVVNIDYGELSEEEQFAIVTDIFENLRFQCYDVALADVPLSAYYEGDINLSGSVEITDAVKVLSYDSNPEKYPIDEIGQVLGDVYNKGDGINNMDALQIQKYLANEITDLTTTE